MMSMKKIINVKRLYLEARLSPPICLPPASKSCFIKSGELLQACLGNIVPIMNSAKTFSYNRTKLSGFCLCIKVKLHILLLWKLFLFSENDSSSSEQWDSLGISGNDINYFWSAILPGREKDSLSSSQNLTIMPHFKRSTIRKYGFCFVFDTKKSSKSLMSHKANDVVGSIGATEPGSSGFLWFELPAHPRIST